MRSVLNSRDNPVKYLLTIPQSERHRLGEIPRLQHSAAVAETKQTFNISYG